MCEICGSMLAAEHTEDPVAELCPKCRRFPLDAELPFDPSQWDYVAPELLNPAESASPGTQASVDEMPAQVLTSPEGEIPEETDEEPEEHVRTCYHCYQIDSGLAEFCPVCGDSYLPPSMHKPHYA